MKKLFSAVLFFIAFAVNAQVSTSTLKAQIDTDITNKSGAGSISKVNVGTNLKAIVDYANQQDALKANAASPTLTGNPTAPTATVGDNDTSIASTAFVAAAVTASAAQPLYYSAPLYQDGTSNIIPQSEQSSTLTVGNYTMGTNYRDVLFTRTGVGTYFVELQYQTIPTTVNKCALNFGFSGVRIVSKAAGSTGSVSYIRWNIETRNTEGALADGQMSGFGYMTMIIYP